MRSSLVASLLTAALLTSTGTARAGGDREKQAQALFVDAMKLLAKKQYAEACDKLARSQELDPGMGTQFRLAECYEKLGRMASALEQYTAVADAAKAANKADREAVAKKRAAAIEPRIAKLTIVLPPSVSALPGVTVTRNGALIDQKLWGAPIPVDPGDHIVTVSAPGKKTFEGKVWAEAAAKVTVAVAALEDIAPPPAPPPPPKSMVPAIVLGAAGGAGVILGATFAGLRASRVGEANKLHDQILAKGGDCVGGGGTNAAACKSLSNATSKGDTYGSVSVATFVVGGAALAGMAIYLLLPTAKPSPSTGFTLAPAIAPGHAGLTASGAF